MSEVTAEQVLGELERQYSAELRALPALSTSQVARALGTHESSVKRLCNTGKLSCFRTPGGHRKVSAQSVADYLNHNDMELSPNPNASVPYRLVMGVDTAAKDGDDMVLMTMRRNADGTTSLVSSQPMSSVAGVVIKPDGSVSAIVGQAMLAAALSEDDVVELNQ